MNHFLKEIQKNKDFILSLNPLYSYNKTTSCSRPFVLKKVLISNRGEIAKRFFIALKEEGISSVAIITDPDKNQSWHEFADEKIFIGNASNYVNIPIVLSATLIADANAIYPGYGFLAENPDLLKAIDTTNKTLGTRIIFMGPSLKVMSAVGNKLDARVLAKKAKVPLFEGSTALNNFEEAKNVSGEIGFPQILKLNAGGGGKGMIVVNSQDELKSGVETCIRTGELLYGDETFYIEKFIKNPVHIEVQLFNGQAIAIRKCAVQRRHQKIIEESGEFFLEKQIADSLLDSAEIIAGISGYSDDCGAGTVEFLYDLETKKYGFLEVNTRLQVEHPVTEQSLGIDLAKWQIFLFDGRKNEIPYDLSGKKHTRSKLEKANQFHAIECRICAEDPENNFNPYPGTIRSMILPAFNNVRCDFGYKANDKILPDYDSMIGKLITYGPSRELALKKMKYALDELQIIGILTNIQLLKNIIEHPEFINGTYSNNMITNNPDLVFIKIGNIHLLSAIFASIAEYIKSLYKKGCTCFESRYIGYELLIDPPFLTLTNSFKIKDYKNNFSTLEIIPKKTNQYNIIIDNQFAGLYTVIEKNDTFDAFLIEHEANNYIVRLDRHLNFSIVHINDGKNVVSCKTRVIPIAVEEKDDPIGMVRAPFQSTFVKFQNLKNKEKTTLKTKVIKDEPIIIISAMKMETTICSPIDGEISYLIEDGNIEKLQLNKTPDGLIIGRPIREGEVLFTIEPCSDIKNIQNILVESDINASQINAFFPKRDNTLEILFNENYKAKIFENPQKYLTDILDIILSYFQGFIPSNSIIIDRIASILSEKNAFWTKIDLNNEIENSIDQILNLHFLLKQFFSPALKNNIILFNELKSFINSLPNQVILLDKNFAAAIDKLFAFYGIKSWVQETQNLTIDSKISLFSILRAYHSCLKKPDVFVIVLNGLKYFKKINFPTIDILKKSLSHEEAEIDNSIAMCIKNILLNHTASMDKHITNQSIDGLPSKLFSMVKYAIENPTPQTVPDKILNNFANIIKNKIDILSSKGKVLRLQYADINFVTYSMHSQDAQNNQINSCFIFCILTDIFLNKTNHDWLDLFEKTINNALMLISTFQRAHPYNHNWIEFIVEKEFDESFWEDIKFLDLYNKLKMLLPQMLYYYRQKIIDKFIINLRVKDQNTNYKIKPIILKHIGNEIKLDLLLDNDPVNPYNISKFTDRKTKILLERSKWPLEAWINQTLDPESFEEVKIASIDNVKWINPKTSEEEPKPVGSKIFTGNIGNSPVCYYFKDSRVNGGATGNLEGLKYFAAIYLSKMKGIPLYVWNDGAGANIKEGMIALNRAANGFMMNTIANYIKDRGAFRKYIESTYDNTLKKLIAEIDKSFNHESDLSPFDNHMIISVSIGSSSGLDVYGASQSTIQIMLDDENCYRVLTGSRVINSVTGESLSNYDIGGAKIMGKTTGTTDIVANDKLELITIIKRLNKTICETGNTKFSDLKIQISENKINTPSNEYLGNTIISEELISNTADCNMFVPFKHNYYGSSELLGGIMQLGGKRTMIIGAMFETGITTLSSLIKTKELLVTAKKLSSNIIAIFGENFYSSLITNDGETLRTKIDVQKNICEHKDLIISIVTSVNGLNETELIGASDVVIFVAKEKLKDDLPKRLFYINDIATFICDSINSAMNLSAKLIELICIRKVSGSKANEKLPRLPEKITEPFDILNFIIDPICDNKSFIEFYKNMNDPEKGPALITGIGRIDGKTVGIIADQPAILNGAPDAKGLKKYRIFVGLLNKLNIPLLMISNSPGFIPGAKQERLRIQQEGAQSLDMNILSKIPVISLVLNQNYGGRQIHAFSKALRPNIIYMSLEKTVLAVMGAQASFDLFHQTQYFELIAEGRKDDAQKLKSDYFEMFNKKSCASNDAFKTGILDILIPDVKDIREEIIKVLSKQS